MARLESRKATSKLPHHKSARARDAESIGERAWTGWTLKLLIQEVLKANQKDVSEAGLRSVKNREFLRVKLLESTQKHHTALRLPPPHDSRMTQYYRLNQKAASKLTSAELEKWRMHKPDDAELDLQVENKTGAVFYRNRRA